MFDIGWSEMLVVGVVALLVIGPKDLPGALRQLGKWMGAVRRMAADFQGQVNEVMKEAELDELRREVQNLRSGIDKMADPVRSIGNEVEAVVKSDPSAPALPQPPAHESLPPPEPAPSPSGGPAAPQPAEPAKPKAAKKPAAKKPAASRKKAETKS